MKNRRNLLNAHELKRPDRQSLLPMYVNNMFILWLKTYLQGCSIKNIYNDQSIKKK